MSNIDYDVVKCSKCGRNDKTLYRNKTALEFVNLYMCKECYETFKEEYEKSYLADFKRKMKGDKSE